MIAYGTRAKLLASGLQTEKCLNCSTMNSIQVSLYQRLAHVFWLPFFPIGKTGVSQCRHCRQVLELRQFPPATKAVYESLKLQAKTPIWTFSGLAVIAILISIGVYSGIQKNQRVARLILKPTVGDIYSVKTTDNQYTLYKIREIQGDSAFLSRNKFETDRESGLDAIRRKGDDAYSADEYSFSGEQLKMMANDGTIRDIRRP